MPKTKSTNAIRKTRGRPADASGVDVRGNILASAETLFAMSGYSGTSIRQIAEAANVTPAMIHYYFGDKESLLRSVLEAALEPLARAIEKLKGSDDTTPKDIAQLLMSTVSEHPNLPYLVMREVMLPGGVMQSHFAAHLAPRLGGALPAILESAAGDGRIRDDLPPSVGALAILSMAMFPFIVRPVAERVLELRLSGKPLERFRSQFADFIARGFAP